jgi:hypothetical protein
MSVLVFCLLAGALVAYLATTNHEDAAPPECGRRGCRRSAGWQGCNHSPRTDGSASGSFHQEE